jgi:nitrogen fixation/metabolism regulation signal transduction histidine kinase
MILDTEVPDAGDILLLYQRGRSELLYNNGEYVAKIGRKLTGLIKPVSLFSYLFVIIVIIILLLLIINSLFPYLPKEFNFTLSNQISLRNKIQVSVLALIVLSFIIIGIVTVFYFRSTSEKNYLDKLTQTASSLQYEIQENIKTDKIEKFDSLFNESIQSLAIKYNTHIQIFDKSGLLVQTSDLDAVKAGVLKDRLDVKPLLALKKDGETIHIHDHAEDPEEDYKMAFFSLVSESNTLLGFAGLPVYPGSADADHSVKDFMGTLLNVYVFLLLIAGAFALAVANSITRPMTVLGQKLKEFKLGKSNEPLEWKTKDELGILIQEYNQMIVKLDESADLLALTEREVAWREMAKQVAHEIKNPLTPMRLSIQHLQHAMQNADPIESRQLVQRVGMTLIEQIDNLSKIAAEFSTFAKMPKPQYERIILNDLVTSVHDLFKKRDDMDFNLYVPIDEIYVNADKSHLLRVLNNLIKNAIQAIPGSRRGVIDIRLEIKGDRTIIQVCDNGKGISREMREKVFYPNFTTKTSGTGLGLAISKNIVESFGGRIYFETEEGVGTKFYFELPLLKNVDQENSYRQGVDM